VSHDHAIINGSGTSGSLRTCFENAAKDCDATFGVPPSGGAGEPSAGGTPNRNSTLPAGRSRNGKIARLPLAIREQLNQRLQNGEQGKDLVLWLNALPEVQALLQAAFGGHPITDGNVSQWRQGGYLHWAAGQRMHETVCAIMDSTATLKAAVKGGLTNRMSLMMAAIMASQMP